MNSRERWDDLGAVIRAGVDRGLSRTWTALPVKVLEDTKDGHVVKLQPLIKGKQTDAQGTKSDVEMPHLGGECPIQYSSGGGFTITHPIKAGDEGIAVFSARCIDEWWDKGGIQPQHVERRHSLSDAMYIPGIRSKPRKLGGNGTAATIDLRSNQTKPVSLESVQIRTDSGDFYIELTKDTVNIVCKTCNIKAEDSVNIDTKLVTIKASDKIHCETPLIETTGDITAGGTIAAGSEVHAGSDVKAGGDVRAGDSSGGVSLSWTPTAAVVQSADPSIPIPGILQVISHLPTNVSTIGDNFSISGAINFAAGQIPGGSDIINQVHQVVSIINSQNFSAALSALPGQIGQIGGNPVLSAVVSLLGHDHHGVMGGPDISQQPVTGT